MDGRAYDRLGELYHVHGLTSIRYVRHWDDEDMTTIALKSGWGDLLQEVLHKNCAHAVDPAFDDDDLASMSDLLDL